MTCLYTLNLYFICILAGARKQCSIYDKRLSLFASSWAQTNARAAHCACARIPKVRCYPKGMRVSNIAIKGECVRTSGTLYIAPRRITHHYVSVYVASPLNSWKMNFLFIYLYSSGARVTSTIQVTSLLSLLYGSLMQKDLCLCRNKLYL